MQVTQRHSNNNTEKQYADETARVEITPHKQMMIDLEYFKEELKTDGFEAV
jgi:hypothetical protein